MEYYKNLLKEKLDSSPNPDMEIISHENEINKEKEKQNEYLYHCAKEYLLIKKISENGINVEKKEIPRDIDTLLLNNSIKGKNN